MRIVVAVLGVAVLVGGGAAARAGEAKHAEPPRKSGVCEAMGPGFVQVEGSATCVKVSGSVRADFEAARGGASFAPATGR